MARPSETYRANRMSAHVKAGKKRRWLIHLRSAKHQAQAPAQDDAAAKREADLAKRRARDKARRDANKLAKLATMYGATTAEAAGITANHNTNGDQT